MSSVVMLLLASAALLVRLGQAVSAMGIARAKNVASAGFRNLIDLLLASLCFWAIGAAILFQIRNPYFGIRTQDLIGWGPISLNWFPMLSAILIGTSIVAPALAERSRLLVPLLIGALLAALVIPVLGHWTWRGWLSELGFLDVAGAGAIHLAPAVCATIAAVAVGARSGKYNHDGSSNMIPGHSVLMLLLSVMLMLIGWIPYILMMDPMYDVSAVNIGANVLIAAAAAGLISLVISHWRYGKTDVLLTCIAMMGGLVSITAAGGRIGAPAAFVCGLVAGILVPAMAVIIDLRWKIDDPAGVIAIHGVGGIWALLAAALFDPVPAAQRLRLLGVQLLGILVIVAVAAVLCGLLLLILRGFGSLRTSDADEFDGLDLAEHDINAHPDFQQTMIKSYHLREA